MINSNFYISTVAFTTNSLCDIEALCIKNDWNLEFSSGLPASTEMIESYKNSTLGRMPHNYFPAPKDPFVINLASANANIRNRSIQHCLQGLELASYSGSPFFAAHAGFCIDPDPNELGKKLQVEPNFNKEHHKSLFLESVRIVLEKAHALKIDFLIENNVLAPFNFINGINPLLCCDYDDINWLFTKIADERLGLLLDTAHLKVSCTTLKLNLEGQFESLKSYIKALHHSDNDGLADTNEPLNEDYWFLKYKSEYKRLVQVLEVKSLTEKEITQQLKLLK